MHSHIRGILSFVVVFALLPTPLNGRVRRHTPAVRYLGYIDFEPGSSRITNQSKPFLDDLRTYLDADDSLVAYIPLYLGDGERPSLRKARVESYVQA